MKKIDKETLSKAISVIGMYTDNQSKVLCELVDSAVDNVVYTPVVKINQKTGVARPSIYTALNKFMIDGVIQQDVKQKGSFIINQDKIDFIIKSYKKQL